MAPVPPAITRIDARRDDLVAAIARISRRLSLEGDIVSESARQKTMDVFGEPLTPGQVVERICREVRQRGTEAVLHYSSKLDGADLCADGLRVTGDELAAAHAGVDGDFLDTVREVKARVEAFQSRLVPEDKRIELPGGGYVAQRYRPLARVGICVPGGAAAYPSTVLMTVVPAQSAGVREIAVVVPPTPFGAYSQEVLATCHELGVCEVYRVGGAHGVAALAYGAEPIPRVDKIVGPGNLFVALAKKLVYGDVDIDSIAGPSEVVVLADDSARADHVAADLIAQAEHSPGASLLISTSAALVDDVAVCLDEQLARLSRGDLARQSLEEYGALIYVENLDQAVAATNQFAPEHLHIATRDPEALLERIDCVGAAFLGHHSPVAVGDYVAGPSHVLPTGGTARFASALSATDFVRSTSVISFQEADLAAAAPHVRLLADREQLTAHRASVDIRLESGEQAR